MSLFHLRSRSVLCYIQNSGSSTLKMLFHCLLGLTASLESFKSLFPWNASFFSGCLQGFFPFLWFLVVWSWRIWAWISFGLSCFGLFELVEFISLSFVKIGELSVMVSSNNFFGITLSITFWNTNGTNVRPFEILSQDPEALFFFFKSLFSLLFRIGNNFYSCHFYLHIHKLFPLLYPLWSWMNSVFFFQISAYCIFSVIQFQFGSFFIALILYFLEHSYNKCF